MSLNLKWSYPAKRKSFAYTITSSDLEKIKSILPRYPRAFKEDVPLLRAANEATGKEFYEELASYIEDSPSILVLHEEY